MTGPCDNCGNANAPYHCGRCERHWCATCVKAQRAPDGSRYHCKDCYQEVAP